MKLVIPFVLVSLLRLAAQNQVTYAPIPAVDTGEGKAEAAVDLRAVRAAQTAVDHHAGVFFIQGSGIAGSSKIDTVLENGRKVRLH